MYDILNLIRSFAASRLGALTLGILAICNLIWFAGPSAGLSDVNYRLYAIGALIIIFLIFIFTKWLWLQNRGAKLQQQLQTQQEQQAGRQLEIELLKEKMNEAIAAIKASNLGVKYRGQAALYALPWFLIIGPSAAGKSTLLRHSGLHFPFSKQEDLHVKGFGGTRNCDWWFADEAILLDTAGRYTTEEEDREEWIAFLGLVKKYRPRLPINGIIVAISMADLLTSDREGLQWHVNVIRDRIAELYQWLGYVFPIYLVFTKSDLLHGFNAFYADLDETDRAQIWGVNLLDEKLKLTASETVQQKLQALYVRLTQLRLDKLAMERNRARKSEIYEFPEQFSAAIPRLMEFIQLLFKENPYQEMPNFCGIYFTSGTQEGVPMQRLLGNLRQAFGYMSHNKETITSSSLENKVTKSYFIKNLFSQAIFPNRDFSAKTKKRLRIQRSLQSAAVIAAVAFVITSIIFYSSSFTRNVWVLHEGQAVADDLIDNYAIPNVTLKQTLPALLNAFDYYQSIHQGTAELPWYWRLGLYRGNTTQNLFQDMFFAIMQREFFYPVSQALQQQLTKDANQWEGSTADEREQMRGQYYSALQAYLMLAFPNRIQAAQITPILASVWNQILQNQIVTDSNAARIEAQQYSGIINLYLQLLQDKASQQAETTRLIIPTAVIARARQQLYTPTDVGNLYAQLENAGATALSPVTINQLLTGVNAEMLTSMQTIPGIYTADGWHNFVEPKLQKIITTASHGDWVIDMPLVDLSTTNLELTSQPKINQTEQQQILQALRVRYFADYMQYWLDLLQSVQVVHFSSLSDLSYKFDIFAQSQGPVMELLQQVTANFDLRDSHHEKIPELTGVAHALQQVLGNPVNDKLKADSSIKTYLTQLTAVQNDLQQLSASPNQNRDCQHYAAQLLSGSGANLPLYKSTLLVDNMLNPIDNYALHNALQSLLLAPIKESWRLILVQATLSLNQLWQTQVYQDYQANILTKFPFSDAANNDVALSDLSNFFQPKTGVLWTFLNTYLTPYLALDGNSWRTQQWLGIGANFSPSFLQGLAQANTLSNALFKGNNNQLTFNLEIYPEPTPGLSQIILVINGQDYHYRNGPQQWQTLNWPGADQNQTSELTAIAATGMSPDTLQTQGAWGLFHLLKQAQLQPQPGSIYRATWKLNGGGQHYAVSLLLRSDSNNELLQQLLQDGVELPSSLFTADNSSSGYLP